MQQRSRVYAYITHKNRLLVFDHIDFPEAGTQVPTGTIKSDESPNVAVFREAEEETGLSGFKLISELGNFKYDMTEYGISEIQHAWFYHLCYLGIPHESWHHNETSGNSQTHTV